MTLALLAGGSSRDRESPFSLANGEEFFRQTLDAIQEGICVLSPEFRIIYANQWLRRQFSQEKAVEGKQCHQVLYGKAGVCPWCPASEALASGQAKSRILPHPGVENGNTWLELTAYPIKDGQDRIKAVVERIRDISQAKREEKKREESESFARAVIDSSLDMIIVVDAERHILEFNPAAELGFGYAKEEVLGRGVDILYADPAQGRGIHLSTVSKGTLVGEVKNLRKNGEQFLSLLSASVLEDQKGRMLGVVGVSRDITAQKAAEDALSQRVEQMALLNKEINRVQDQVVQSRNKFKTAFDAMADFIYSVTTQDTVESVNLAAADLAQAHPRELVGLSQAEFVSRCLPSAELQQHCLDSFHRMLASKKRQWRLVTSPARDGDHYFEVTHIPVADQDDKITHAIVHIKDVTTFKRMEMTIREYSESLEIKVAERTRELTEANRELKLLDQLKHDLTNMVVHDMKGPLAELMGNLELLSYQTTSDEAKEPLDLAVLGAEDLLRMIMNLLDIDRLEENSLLVQRLPISFAELAGSVRNKFKTQIKLMGLVVKVQDHTEGPFPGDPDILGRVLQNFLTNAFNHTPEGGSITLSAREAGDGGIILEVTDTGAGIPEKFQDRIFKKFTQAEPGSGPRTSTGLGLTFCKLAVEAHQGRIWFTSQMGKGTTFFVWLPKTGLEA